MEKKMDRRKPDNKWHLRKEIQIGHIITMLMVIFAALTAYFDLDQRIDQGEKHDQYQDQRFNEHIANTNLYLGDIKKDVREIRNTVVSRDR